MQHQNRWVIVFLIIAGLLLSACAKTMTVSAAGEPPVVVEPIEGTELNRVVLSERAAQRLDVQTAPVEEAQVDGVSRLVIPYASVLYDLHGETWIYTNPEPLTFVRAPITIETIEGDTATLVDGPTVGTLVVKVGVAELYGADTGVGK
jgi:hypothetical protein